MAPQSSKMQGAVCSPGESDITFREDLPVPSVASRPDWVVIKVQYCGVCGTDVHIHNGGFPAKPGQLIMGHEFTGKIVEVGSDVTKVKVGDSVVADPNLPCGTCYLCRDAKHHFCATSGLTCARSCLGVWQDGGFAQFVAAPVCAVLLLPEDLHPMHGALIEPLSCVEHGWDRLTLGGTPGSTSNILICGAGIIGLLWACILHHRGYRRLTVSEPSELRRKVAIGLPNVGKVLKVVSPSDVKSNSFDVVIDCTGVAAVMAAAMDALTYGGRLLVFGCCPSDSSVAIKPFDIFHKELTIIGTVIAPFCFQRAIATVNDMSKQGYFAGDLSGVGVQLFPLKDCVDVIKAAETGTVCKPMFQMD